MTVTKSLPFGFLTWLVPFLVSIPLMGKDRRAALPARVFKSLMIVVGSAVGTWLLVVVFHRRPAFKMRGVIVGLLWLGIIISLDLLILIPFTKMSEVDHLVEIALRYLLILIMAIAIVITYRASGGDK